MSNPKSTIAKENALVYETLRNSIISCEERIVTIKINMYIVYFAIFAFGVKYSELMFISFFVLITFQSLMNRERLAVEKTSMYIRIFFEKNENIHWETLHKEKSHLKAYAEATRDFGWYIERFGASILASVSLLFLTSRNSFSGPIVMEIAKSAFAIILFLIVCKLNKKLYINDGDTNHALENDMEAFYNQYYNSSDK